MFSLFVRSPSFTLIGSGSMQWRLEEGFVGIFLYSTVVCSLKSEGKLAGHEKWMHSSSLNHSAVGRRCLKFLFFLFLFPSEFNEKNQKKYTLKKTLWLSVQRHLLTHSASLVTWVWFLEPTSQSILSPSHRIPPFSISYIRARACAYTHTLKADTHLCNAAVLLRIQVGSRQSLC